jgi:hypothetical protein
LARASALHAEGHRFDSDILHQISKMIWWLAGIITPIKVLYIDVGIWPKDSYS